MLFKEVNREIISSHYLFRSWELKLLRQKKSHITRIPYPLLSVTVSPIIDVGFSSTSDLVRVSVI